MQSISENIEKPDRKEKSCRGILGYGSSLWKSKITGEKAVKLLFLCYGEAFSKDIPSALFQLGHQVELYPELLRKTKLDGMFMARLIQCLAKGYDAVLSVYFLEAAAKVCEANKVPYLAWTYDSLQPDIYNLQMFYKHTYLFMMDKKECGLLKEIGMPHVFHLPLAVSPKRLARVSVSVGDEQRYGADISFIGSLYKNNKFDKINSSYPEPLKRQFEETLQKLCFQWKCGDIYSIIPNEDIELLKQILRRDPSVRYLTDRMYYGYYYFMTKCASAERFSVLSELSKTQDTALYTYHPTPDLPLVRNRGQADYFLQMPKIFVFSKINLNLTLPSIESGLPLRVFDILGAGGFLLSNFQPEFLDYFEPEKDVALASTLEELLEKADFYLKHEKERIRIAVNGHKNVCANHTFEKRLEKMLQIVFGS